MKDVTTLVNAPAILVKLGGENVTQSCFQLRAMRIGGPRGVYIKPIETSNTLSRRTKSENPCQTRRTCFWASEPTRRRASVLSSRRGMLG